MERIACYQVLSQTNDMLTIKDVGPWHQYQTVTNAAEEVVAELLGSGILKPGQRLAYYDSNGDLDEILIKEGRYAGIRLLSKERSYKSL